MNEDNIKSEEIIDESNEKMLNNLSDNNNLNDTLKKIEDNRLKNNKSQFCRHVLAFIKKTFIVFLRNKKLSILTLSSPILIILILIFLQVLLDYYSIGFINKNPNELYLYNIPKCYSLDSNCTTILGIILDRTNSTESQEEVSEILKYISKENNLNYNEDIVLSHNIKTYEEFSNYLDLHKNKTFFGVVFCYDFIDVNISGTLFNLPCKPEYDKEKDFIFYTIVYNMSNTVNDFMRKPYEPRQKDKKLMKLQLDIDNGIIQQINIRHKKQGKKYYDINPRINLTYQDYPTTENRLLEGTKVVNNLGLIFFLLIPFTLFIFILVQVVKEKQCFLRKSLIVIGFTATEYWVSWILICCILSFFLTILFIIGGHIVNWELFWNVPFIISFVLYYFYFLDFQFLALMLSSMINTMKTAYTASFAILLLTGIIQSLFPSPVLRPLLYSDTVGYWIHIFTAIMSTFFQFNFVLSFCNVCGIATTVIDIITFANHKGRRYKYEDLFIPQKGKIFRLGYDYVLPTCFHSMILMILNGVLYILIGIYFDNVIKDNKGVSKSKLFFIKDTIKFISKCFKKKNLNERNIVNDREMIKNNNSIDTNDNINNQDNIIDNYNKNDKLIDTKNKDNENNNLQNDDIDNIGNETILKEKNRIIMEENNSIFLDGLRIINLTKEYHLSNGRILKALNGIYFDVKIGELLTLLGHNGAGKTTLVNSICGNINITSGSAKIKNIDVKENVKKLIGLCPQHDILWEELTPYEHIELYGTLRNYEKNDIKTLCEMKMKEVNLEGVMNDMVGTFSGGMKRRISILLSTVGNPSVIFLDEPTTGLDPVSRRFIWDMIRKIKNKSALILTTHAMNEAEYLSDKICIIKKGEMKCIGTPLELKQLYSNGYLLTLICNKNCEQKVQEIIQSLSKSIKIISSKAGSIIFNLPYENIGEINWFIKLINKEYDNKIIKPLQGLVKECDIQQTSIEEIFLKISKDDGTEEDEEIYKKKMEQSNNE